MDEDDRGPRTSAAANDMLRADAARRLLENPKLMPQPRNESRPGGWPVAEAIFTFAPESTRSQVSLHLGLKAEGFADPVIAERLTAYGWWWLRQRLSSGEFSATGIPDGEIEPTPMDPSIFDSSEYDQAKAQVTVGSRNFLGVRVYSSSTEIGKKTSTRGGESKGGAAETYNWEEFRQELIRAVWVGDLIDRRAIRAHMKAWCAREWDKQPDESRIRQVLNALLHAEIPESAKG